VFVLFFDSALGNWNMTIYDVPDPAMIPDIHLKKGGVKKATSGNVMVVGRIYHSVFLLLNQVILFNMLVGILGNTYAKLDEINHGLYTDILIKNFPFYEYDHQYGFMGCGLTPFNFMLLLMAPIMMICDARGYPKEELNRIFTTIIYLPIAFLVTLYFTISNILMMPFTYLYHLSAQIIKLVQMGNVEDFN
jgi:hypothetical protein